MYALQARLKAIYRWVAFKMDTDYKEYGPMCDVPDYDGWYEWRGRCIAFRKTDGTVQFVW
jgi:hypothetical protein